MLARFPWRGQGVIPRAASLAGLKEQVRWVEKSDVQDGDPRLRAIVVVPRLEFASPQSSPASRRGDVQCCG